MKYAYLRLFLITLSSLLFLGIIIFSLRQLGSLQKYSPWTHPLLSKTTLTISQNIKQGTSKNLTYLPVYYDHYKKEWFYKPQNETSTQPLLSWLKENSPFNGVYLHILNKKGAIKKLLSTVGQFVNDEQVVFESRSSHLYRTIKKLKPRWVFVATEAEVQKFKLLSSLYLETLAPLKADLVRFQPNELNTWPRHALMELKKRHIKRVGSSLSTSTVHSKLIPLQIEFAKH